MVLFTCPEQEERCAGRAVGEEGLPTADRESTCLAAPAALCCSWRARVSLAPRELGCPHVPDWASNCLYLSKSSQGRSSLWGQQGWGSSSHPGQGGGAEAQGEISALGKLTGQNLVRCAGLGMPKEGQTWLWQCRNRWMGPAELGSVSAMFRLGTRTSPRETLSGREECEGHGAHQCCGGPVPWPEPLHWQYQWG